MANSPTSHKSSIDRRLPPSQQGADIRKSWKGEFTIDVWDGLAELAQTEQVIARKLRSDVEKGAELAEIKAKSDALAQVSKALQSSRDAWFRLVLYPTSGRAMKSGKQGGLIQTNAEPLDVMPLSIGQDHPEAANGHSSPANGQAVEVESRPIPEAEASQ